MTQSKEIGHSSSTHFCFDEIHFGQHNILIENQDVALRTLFLMEGIVRYQVMIRRLNDR